MKLIQIVPIVVAIVAFPSKSQGTLVIGGFDAARIGPGSIDGVAVEEFRTAVTEGFTPEFGGVAFKSGNTLSKSFLDSIDVLIVGAPSLLGPISLTSEEQQNLLNFVKKGGGAIIFSDNDDYAGVPGSDLANETFLDPFGVDSTGKINSAAIATVTNTDHPVTDGQFGVVSSVAGYYPGWFDGLGANAASLASYDVNNKAALLVIDRGGLSPSSGGVVFLSDADMFVDSADGGYFGTADNQTLILNSVKYVVPEPAVLTSAMCALIVLGARRRTFR